MHSIRSFVRSPPSAASLVAPLNRSRFVLQLRRISWNPDDVIRKPKGLINYKEIASLEEWNAKKNEVKEYRKRRIEMKREREERGRPHRPRIALRERNEFLVKRRESWAAIDQEREKSGLKWDLKAAVLLERLPVIVPEPEDWEVEWQDFQSKIRWLYTIEWPKELNCWRKDTGELPPGFREQYENCFVPLAPRVTEADKTNDRKSLDRCLDQRIFHIYRKDSSTEWKFLQRRVRQERGETLRECAQRVMLSSIHPNQKLALDPTKRLTYWHVGNCPSGYHWRKYNEKERADRNAFGEKVFHMRTQLIHGEPIFAQRDYERLWVSKHELPEYLGEHLREYFRWEL